MKRIKVTALVKDAFDKKEMQESINPYAGEIEAYEEKKIQDEKNVIEEHSFDALLDGAFDFAQGLWLTLKGFWKMSVFAIILIVEGIKYLWKGGWGSLKKKEDEKKVNDKKAKS